MGQTIGHLDRSERATSGLAAPVPDFSRPVFCMFGVTFDNIDMDRAVTAIVDAARARRRCTITTPNLHFVARSAADPAFRDSIVRSDLCLIDGMPLVWLGRWFGVNVRGRITGSNLFERLWQARDPAQRLAVYFFGGPPGIARLAADRLNAEEGGLCCVGHHFPGYGSVEAISHPDTIREINASGADFLVVSLGAEKGQAWIEHNRAALDVPVVSHLGAVVNFTAGTLRRAPAWVQEAGFEWAWRISREPLLWRRYLTDGLIAVGLIVRASLDAGLAGLLDLGASGRPSPDIAVVETGYRTVIKIAGPWRAADLGPLRAVLQTHAAGEKRLVLDLGDTVSLDSAAAGLLALLKRYRLDRGWGWYAVNASPRLKRRLRAYGVGDLVV